MRARVIRFLANCRVIGNAAYAPAWIFSFQMSAGCLLPSSSTRTRLRTQNCSTGLGLRETCFSQEITVFSLAVLLRTGEVFRVFLGEADCADPSKWNGHFWRVLDTNANTTEQLELVVFDNFLEELDRDVS